MTISFSTLHKGQRVRISSLHACPPTYRQKLMSMGLHKGSEFTVVTIAPLGCPVAIELDGTLLCLRKDEAQMLELESLDHVQ